MKKFLTIMFITTILSSYSVYVSNQTVSNFSNLQLENIEALAQEGEQMLKCTKIKRGGNCYKNNKWICTYVSEVTEYEVPASSPFDCQHYTICSCPSGCIAKPCTF